MAILMKMCNTTFTNAHCPQCSNQLTFTFFVIHPRNLCQPGDKLQSKELRKLASAHAHSALNPLIRRRLQFGRLSSNTFNTLRKF